MRPLLPGRLEQVGDAWISDMFLPPLFLLVHSLALEYLRYALTAKHT